MAARNMTVIFGLLTIASKTEVATASKVSLSTLCVGQPGHEPHDPSPKTMPSVCAVCGPITDTSALVKGVKAGQTYTLVDKDAVAEAKETYAADYKNVLNVVPHPATEFLNATGAGDSIHYVTPADVAGEGHYQLLVKLITEHPELAFVGLYTPVSATSMYHLTVRDGVLLMAKRTREEAMKPTPSVGGEVNDVFYTMLEGALPTFVVDYNPATYEDTYGRTLADMIANGETVNVGGGETNTTLRSIESDDDIMAKLATLVGKPTAKKAPAKKAAVKKAPAKKKVAA